MTDKVIKADDVAKVRDAIADFIGPSGAEPCVRNISDWLHDLTALIANATDAGVPPPINFKCCFCGKDYTTFDTVPEDMNIVCSWCLKPPAPTEPVVPLSDMEAVLDTFRQCSLKSIKTHGTVLMWPSAIKILNNALAKYRPAPKPDAPVPPIPKCVMCKTKLHYGWAYCKCCGWLINDRLEPNPPDLREAQATFLEWLKPDANDANYMHDGSTGEEIMAAGKQWKRQPDAAEDVCATCGEHPADFPYCEDENICWRCGWAMFEHHYPKFHREITELMAKLKRDADCAPEPADAPVTVPTVEERTRWFYWKGDYCCDSFDEVMCAFEFLSRTLFGHYDTQVRQWLAARDGEGAVE